MKSRFWQQFCSGSHSWYTYGLWKCEDIRAGKTETAKEEASSDKEVTQEPVSEEEAAADGFTDGSDGESAKLDTSEELTGIHHAGIDIKDYGSIEIELDAIRHRSL